MKAKNTLTVAIALAVFGIAQGAQAQPEWRTWGAQPAESATQTPGAIPPAPVNASEGGGSTAMMAEMLQRISQLEGELRELRGQLEVQGNDVDRLKRAQRDGFADLDQRIDTLERAARGEEPAAEPAPSAEPEPAPAPAPEPEAEPPSQPAPQPPEPADQPPASDTDQRALYDRAFNLLREGRYDDAVSGFERTIAANPQGNWAPHALYWKGEAQYVNQNRDAARQSFEQVLVDYPNSARVADANLKIAYLDYDAGEFAKARARLEKIVADHEGTHAAGLAQQRLNRMTQEGR